MMKVIQLMLGGKGGGKGKWGGRSNDIVAQTARKTPEKMVWLGGLPKVGKEWKKANKELLEQFKAAGCSAKFVDIKGNGTGAAIFASAEDATSAIATLAGTEFRGSTLEVDVWTRKK